MISQKEARLGISFLRIKKYQKISKRIKEIPSLEKRPVGQQTPESPL
jgi:hypothetical protein